MLQSTNFKKIKGSFKERTRQPQEPSRNLCASVFFPIIPITNTSVLQPFRLILCIVPRHKHSAVTRKYKLQTQASSIPIRFAVLPLLIFSRLSSKGVSLIAVLTYDPITHLFGIHFYCPPHFLLPVRHIHSKSKHFVNYIFFKQLQL